MVPQDLPQVWRHCRAQNRRDGTSYGLPPIFDGAGMLLPSVPMALSTVDAKGRVHAGHVFERTVEYMGFGGGVEATEVAMAEAPAVYYVLRAMGFRDLHIQVPKDHAHLLEDGLRQRMGMVRDDDRLAHFYREL